jgi:hypothetical protein
LRQHGHRQGECSCDKKCWETPSRNHVTPPKDTIVARTRRGGPCTPQERQCFNWRLTDSCFSEPAQHCSTPRAVRDRLNRFWRSAVSTVRSGPRLIRLNRSAEGHPWPASVPPLLEAPAWGRQSNPRQ